MDESGESLENDIARFVGDPDADELAAALLVGRALTRDFDSARCRAHLDALADACPEGAHPWTYLADLGFAGNQDDVDVLRDSRLDSVLDNKQGIPISLGVLLIHVAKRAGHPAVGINFPGHFLVRVEDQLVDPFVMAEVSEEQALNQFGSGEQRSRRVFPEAPPQAILMRMLNNVKYQFARAAQWDRALDMLDWQLRVQPDNPHLFLERGELWSRMGGVGAARDAYARVLELSDDDQLRGVAKARLAGLTDSGTIH